MASYFGSFTRAGQLPGAHTLTVPFEAFFTAGHGGYLGFQRQRGMLHAVSGEAIFWR